MRRRPLTLSLLCFLLLLLPLCAQAREINRLYVWDGNAELPADGKLPPDAIQWFARGDTNRYLYLPAGIDSGNLRVSFTGVSSFTVDGQTIASGDVTNVFVPGQTVTIKNGGNSYNVIVMQAENVSSVYIKTKSGNIASISKSKRNKEAGSLCVRDESGVLAYQNDFDYIRVRGNYSFYPYKKSFHIKLDDSAPLLGMASGKTWLLIASYCDNSMLRNAMTLELAAAAGMPHTTDYRFVSVYVNTVYYGTYLLTEKIQVNKNRLSLTDLEKATELVNDKELSSYKKQGTQSYKRGTIKYSAIPNNPEDITGGYLMQLELDERYGESSSGFVTAHGQSVLIKSPEYASKAQVEYISALVNSFENAVWAEDGVDPDTGKHYSDIADMDSLVGKYLIEEITKNVDANKSSFYIYKDSDTIDGKLYFGPVWDYDIAYGNYAASYYKKTLADPSGLHAATDDYKKYYWFPRLYAHADFQDAVKQAYQARFRPCLEVLLGLRAPSTETGNLHSISVWAEQLAAAAQLNFSRWRTFNADEFPVKTGADFAANIAYLQSFLTQRMAYLDSIWLDQ